MKREPNKYELTSRERIKYLIDTKCNGSQQEFADRVEIGKSSVSQYVKGSNFPSNLRAGQIAEAFGLNPAWVMGFDSPMYEESSRDCPTDKEWSIIEKYRLLDDYGVRAVDAVLDIEYDRCITSASRVMDNVRPIRYYQKTASAGPGQILFDDPAIDRIDIPNTNDYCRVAYAVGVNGDSMEPDYQDGDILLIEPATDLQIGEVGIFYVDGKSYVKKLGDGELISLNPAYDPIPLDVYSRCMGRVIDKL